MSASIAAVNVPVDLAVIDDREVGLCGPLPAMNEFADVAAPPGFRIAADVGAEQPCAGSAANDLASFAGVIPA